MTAIKNPLVSEEALRALAKKRIFFGHQSVGYNIVEGVQDILRERASLGVNVVELGAGEPLVGPALAHAAVGRNGEPESKLREFAERLRAGLGSQTDIVALKFCYVDFEHNAAPDRIFACYRDGMTELAKAFPRTRFVHITVPLRATTKGLKMHLRNLLGRPDKRVSGNETRDEFNQLMRQQYQGRQPLFDLAAAEATGPDGSASCDTRNGKRVPSLANEYTADGGHLNERGRLVIAARFLALLASL